MNQTNERILEKVRRLLALSKSSNPHEAAAAAAKAQELLTRHKLAMADVPDKDREEYTRRFLDTANSAQWISSLVNMVGRAHYCRVVSHRNGIYAFIGRPSDIKIALYVYAYLAREIIRLADDAWKDFDGYARSPREWKTAFHHGAVKGVGDAFDAQRREHEAQPDTRSLIIVSDKALAEAKGRYYPQGTIAGRRVQRFDNAEAFQVGYRAGRDISIRKGIDSHAHGSRKAIDA